MKRMIIASLTGMIAATLAGAALAGPADTPGLDKRQVNQEKRIQQGVKSGQLTPEEAARLEKQQQRIQKTEEAAKADGKVTAQERKKLHKMQDNASENIYRKKHNKRKAETAQ